MAENQENDYTYTKKMLLDLINNKEINEIKSIDRKVIFWYDADQAYTSVIQKIKKEIDNEDIEILIFDNNSFGIRYNIEIKEPKKNFVIYFPYAKKKDSENLLLDLENASGYELYFNPDDTTKLIIDLGLIEDNRNIIMQNKKFFGNQTRMQKFKDFIAPKNNNTINYIITSVILGIKSITEDDILKNIVKTYVANDAKYTKLKNFGNEKFILELFNKNFGTDIKKYSEIDELLEKLIFTYFFEDLNNKSKLDKYGEYILPQTSNAEIFINNLMNDKTTEKVFEKLSNKVYQEFELKEMFNEENALEYETSDAFKIIDQNIINNIINQLTKGIFNYNKFKSIILNRQSKYWYSYYENEYKTLLYIIEYLKEEKLGVEKIKSSELEYLAKLYTEELYKIDMNYRKILFYYDQIKDNDNFKDLLEIIENHYTNNYMFELSLKWDNALEKLSRYDSNKMVMQNKFFSKYIEPQLAKNKNGRIIVIISDGFRYELAKQLNNELKKIAKHSEIQPMLGLVPSYTKLGKAVLLPNKRVSLIEETYDVLIDGKKTSSTSDRAKILQSEVPESLVIMYDELVTKYKKAEWKNLFLGKKLIYIYHDNVDKIGEKNPDSVAEAGEKAIEQLYGLVESLHKTFSSVNVFITSDHGFFYKRGEIKKINKIKKLNKQGKTKDRFIYSRDELNNKSVMSIKVDYIFDNYDGYAKMPTGHNIFAKQGTQGKYFHGGCLPQELLIPLIDFKSSRKGKEVSKVGIVYSGLSYKITSIVTHLNFTQNTNVDEENIEGNYLIHFEDENKNIISNEVKVAANRTEKNYNDRVFREKFVFKSIEYPIDKNYYLVIKDIDTGVETSRLKFDIDIAFWD